MTTAKERRRPKWWPKSKTVWVNLFVGLVMILELTTEYVTQFFPDSIQIIAGLALVNNIINIALRFVRTQSLSIEKPPEPMTPQGAETLEALRRDL